MCHCLVIKDNKGKIHYAILLLFAAMIIIMFSMIIEKRILINLRDKVDNELVVAAFSGGLFDLEKMYESVLTAKKQTESGITYDFDLIYKNLNIYLDHKKAYDTVENILANNLVGNNTGSKLIENIEIETFILYNLCEKPEIHKYAMKQYLGEMSAKGENFYTPNGVNIDTTSIYVKIGFELKGFLGITRKTYLEKCISLEY